MNKLCVPIIRMDKQHKYRPDTRPADMGITSIRVQRMCAWGKWQEEILERETEATLVFQMSDVSRQ